MMQQNEQRERLSLLTQQVKKGYECVKERKYEEGRALLEPYVDVLHSEAKPNVRLLVNYSIAQVGTKDFEGFLNTYEQIKSLDQLTEKDQKLVDTLDQFFEDLMSQMQKDD